MELIDDIVAAQAGDLPAYGRVVKATEAMVFAVSRRVLGPGAEVADCAQETFLRAYRGLPRLGEPAAFPGFLRRIAIRTAQDFRRRRRTSFVSLDAAPEVPFLDEHEERWSEAQRVALGRALLTLGAEERRVTERFYHGGWSLARLASAAGVAEPAMRKRLQRIRDSLRKEIEMVEQQANSGAQPGNLSSQIVALLARPQLMDLPENPVGNTVQRLLALFSEFERVETPELIDPSVLRPQLACDPVYVPAHQIFRVESGEILRYDLTLPLLMLARGRGAPLRLISAGKVYRNEVESRTHLAAFHQLELLLLEETRALDVWGFVGRVLGALDTLLPGLSQRVYGTTYPFCARAWDIGVELNGEYLELLGCGVYCEDVVRLLGGDPARHTAIGLGLGLERTAALRFGLTDLRGVEATQV
ncbi:MAG TPA: sigma-70 family RNA polymerase sigma factor [Polyangiales bacterium]